MSARGVVALIGALLAAITLACGDSEPAADETQTPAQEVSAADATPVHRIELGNVPVSIIASGTVVARRVTEIVPEVQGRLVEVSVDVGDEVAKGDALFRIDSAPFEMAAADARAGLALARAEARNAVAEVKRVEQLASERAVSEQRVDQLRTQAAVAQARVEQADARVAQTNRDLSLTVVRAPYAGSIVERRADEGAVAGNSAVLVLQESVALEVVLDVPEAAAAPVRQGDRVELRLEGLARPVVTRVHSVSRRVDPDTRTYEVRAPVPNPDGLVKAGSYVQASIDTAPGSAAPVVPREALLMRDGRTYVFRVEGDRVARIAVQLGRTGPEAAEVAAGLAAGDNVVVGEAVGHLGDGAVIRPRHTAQPVAEVQASETGG